MLRTTVLQTAHSLIGPVSDRSYVNPEYIRATVEMVANLLGYAAGGDYHDDVLILINAS